VPNDGIFPAVERIDNNWGLYQQVECGSVLKQLRMGERFPYFSTLLPIWWSSWPATSEIGALPWKPRYHISWYPQQIRESSNFKGFQFPERKGNRSSTHSFRGSTSTLVNILAAVYVFSFSRVYWIIRLLGEEESKYSPVGAGKLIIEVKTTPIYCRGRDCQYYHTYYKPVLNKFNSFDVYSNTRRRRSC